MASLTQRVIGRMAALLFLGGGAASILLPSPAGASHAGQVTVGVIGVAIGVAAWFAPWERWPRRATLVIAPPAFALFAAAVLLGSYNSSTNALYYMLVFVWIGVSHRRGTALMVAPIAAVAYLVPLVVTGRGDDGVTSVWEVILLSVLVGEGLSWMSTRLRRAEALDSFCVREMHALLRAAESLARERDPAHAPELVATLGRQLLRADATAVFLIEDRDHLIGAAGARWPEPVDGVVVDIDEHGPLAASLRSDKLSLVASDTLPAAVASNGAFRTMILLPFHGSSTVQGMFIGGFVADGPRLDGFAEHVARTFATQSALALERLHAVRTLVEDALRDELTGLGNRRASNRALAGLRASDAVAMLDLDGFKELNDTLGHAAGDDLLTRFAVVLGASLRDEDVAVRFGGDEFLMVFHDAGERAQAIVERLASRWREEASNVTFSAGIAVAGEDEPSLTVLARADQALYEAKRTGRDRVCSAPAALDDRAALA
ncbi:MAG: diguanylate cyclase [Actinomycetota bacterium]